MAQKIIIDADPGIGDALAIALALTDPELDVVGITATAGSVSGKSATQNIQTIVEFLDPAKYPRLGASQEAVPVSESENTPRKIPVNGLNGPTGLGDLEVRGAELHNPHHSAKLMIDLVKSFPNEITLLTLGPLTNVELASERAPEFLELLNGLVCLGGTFSAGGDVTACAEFNIYANPAAARNVLLSPATKTLIPLDVSSRAVLTFEEYDRLPKLGTSKLRSLLEQLLPFAFRAHHQYLGLEGVPLNGVVALASISHPRFFESLSMAMDIETEGRLTRGTTVFDRRQVEQWQKNIDVSTEVDARGVLDYFSRIVRQATL